MVKDAIRMVVFSLLGIEMWSYMDMRVIYQALAMLFLGKVELFMRSLAADGVTYPKKTFVG